MTPIRSYDAAFADQAIAHGRNGLGRAEIAAELGASLADFEAWAAAHPAFAAALADADTLARAWWEAQPRLALDSRKPFRAAAWAKAMAQRYGRSADRPRNTKVQPEQAPSVRTVFRIPDNGRKRRRPGKAD